LCPYSQVKHREDTQDVAEDDQMKIDADERSGGYAMLLMVGIGCRDDAGSRSQCGGEIDNKRDPSGCRNARRLPSSTLTVPIAKTKMLHEVEVVSGNHTAR
jgi:hypothetical protein